MLDVDRSKSHCIRMTPSQPQKNTAEPAVCCDLGGVDDLLTTTEAAAAARVSVRTLENYWRDGTGPTRTRIGGRVFISRSDLAAWRASRTDARSTVRNQPAAFHPATAA